MSEFEKKKLDCLEALIDNEIETYGVRHTIAWLLDFGFTVEELIAWYFDEEDVAYVAAHPDEDYF